MKSPLSYFGGKSRLAPKIISLIPKHICYIEPFAGAAWVFFKKPESKVEVLNDLDNNIVNVYRIIQHHPEEFLKQFKTLFISRRLFDLMKRHDDECLTDIHRAVKWFYLLKVAFGSQMNGAFGYGTTRPANLNILDLEESIIQIHWRLARVTIENRSYSDIVERYDRSHTFFYLDPPYYGIKGYRLNFEPDDFAALAGTLAGIKGRFLMSLNDHKEVRRIFGGFRLRPVTLRYSVARDPGSRGNVGGELLISNF